MAITRMNIEVEAELHAAIKRIADEDRRSMIKEIVVLLEEAIAARDKGKPNATR